ncbi:hypothetical protein BC628DRAFT_1400282 [Trametes gibbosa]|nr:hypothetical protein BC628DRAFT_1400282 [Trametes gibbosa]
MTKADTTRCADCRQLTASSPLRSFALLRCRDGDGNLIALPLRHSQEHIGAAENVSIGVLASCGIYWHRSTRVVRLPADVFTGTEAELPSVEASLLRHYQTPIQPRSQRAGFSKSKGLESWDAYSMAVFRLAPNCEEELRAVGCALTPLDCKRRPWDHRIIVTTTLEGVVPGHPRHGRKMRGSPIRIQLVISDPSAVTACFSVDRSGSSSPVDPVHGVAPALDGVVSNAVSKYSRTSADSPMQASSTSTLDMLTSARVITEAEFTLPSDFLRHTEGDEVPVDCVRLLRLRLERPPESAYEEGCKALLLSVELSEPLKSSTSTTPIAKEPGTSSADDYTDRLLEEAAAILLGDRSTYKQDNLRVAAPALDDVPAPLHDATQQPPAERSAGPTRISEETDSNGRGPPGPTVASSPISTEPGADADCAASVGTKVFPIRGSRPVLQVASHAQTGDQAECSCASGRRAAPSVPYISCLLCALTILCTQSGWVSTIILLLYMLYLVAYFTYIQRFALGHLGLPDI